MSASTSDSFLPDNLDLWQATLQWQPTPEQLKIFQHIYTQVVAANRQFNLTRITEPDAFWEKHLWDSLRGLKPWLAPASTISTITDASIADSSIADSSVANWTVETSTKPLNLIDVGTGAGFPGLPAAIALPTVQVTLLDSTQKKVNFLSQLTQTLNQPFKQQLHCYAARAEAFGHDPRQRAQFDLVLIRAVAAAEICAEYCLPLLKLQGVAVLYRGQWQPKEAAVLQHALVSLGGELAKVDAFQTPLTQGDRHCLYIRKVADTPSVYPRPIGVPAQKPLGQL